MNVNLSFRIPLQEFIRLVGHRSLTLFEPTESMHIQSSNYCCSVIKVVPFEHFSLPVLVDQKLLNTLKLLLGLVCVLPACIKLRQFMIQLGSISCNLTECCGRIRVRWFEHEHVCELITQGDTEERVQRQCIALAE